MSKLAIILVNRNAPLALHPHMALLVETNTVAVNYSALKFMNWLWK
jgi:hypothetical protein